MTLRPGFPTSTAGGTGATRLHRAGLWGTGTHDRPISLCLALKTRLPAPLVLPRPVVKHKAQRRTRLLVETTIGVFQSDRQAAPEDWRLICRRNPTLPQMLVGLRKQVKRETEKPRGGVTQPRSDYSGDLNGFLPIRHSNTVISSDARHLPPSG